MGATNLETMSVSRRETGRLHMWVMSSMTSLVTCTTTLTITITIITTITLTMYLHSAHTCSGKAAAYSWHKPPPMEWPTSTADLQPRWVSNLHSISTVSTQYLYGIYTVPTHYIHSISQVSTE